MLYKNQNFAGNLLHLRFVMAVNKIMLYIILNT